MRVGIVGARGYSGLELARLLLKHPRAKIAACFAGESAFSLKDYLSDAGADAVPILPTTELSRHLTNLDLIFLATPAEVSMELAPEILKAGVDVIDLSGAFRLPKKTETETVDHYRKWYGFTHSEPGLVSYARFGLVPFATPHVATKAGLGRLVSNPGCYATASLFALIPLLKAGVVDPASLVLDAKSGASGGGRKAVENLLFCEVDGECLPYKVGKHQHLPEITQWTEAFSGQAIDPHFSTHLLPTRRGILVSLYARLNSGKSADSVEAAYREAFSGYPLAQVHRLGSKGAAQDFAMLSMKRISGTAKTHLSFHVEGNKLYAFCTIDNLLKGAAGQAIENFNRLQDFPADFGLADLQGTL